MADQKGEEGHEFDDCLIDHAERCWKAECDNADRISKERHLILTVLIAFLGAALFKLDWLQATISRSDIGGPPGTCVAVTVCVLLVAALICFILALSSLAHKPSKATASAHLQLPTAAYTPAGGMAQTKQKRLAFARTYRAFQELQRRNEKNRGELSDAWSRFATAIALVVLVLAIYIGSKTWSIVAREEGTNVHQGTSENK